MVAALWSGAPGSNRDFCEGCFCVGGHTDGARKDKSQFHVNCLKRSSAAVIWLLPLAVIQVGPVNTSPNLEASSVRRG